MAGLRRLAGQLRAGRLRGSGIRRRRAGALVGPAPAPHRRDCPDPASAGQAAEVTSILNGSVLPGPPGSAPPGAWPRPPAPPPPPPRPPPDHHPAHPPPPPPPP